jgi:gamma-D-glutamyl-L-lysine dipeptidyl-peptidase
MRGLLAALLVLSLLGCMDAGGRPSSTKATRPASTAAESSFAVVDVSVATLWKRPRSLRAVDEPSALNPVEIRRWLAGMTTDERRWLVGRLQTQATYGSKVIVLERSGGWTKVAVRGQPTPLSDRGYPGWVPSRQLTTNLSVPNLIQAGPVAIVTAKTAWLRSPDTHERRIELSFGTRLAVVGEDGSRWLVARPTGGSLAIAKDRVAEYASVDSIPAPSGRRIVATAKQFIGLQYLWAGTSGFGFDCSGLTYMVYRRFGIGMPRDADSQAVNGKYVARSDLRLGDLVFFAGASGQITHVGIYAGGGLMVESPRTGEPVRISPLRSGYAGARRYL